VCAAMVKHAQKLLPWCSPGCRRPGRNAGICRPALRPLRPTRGEPVVIASVASAGARCVRAVVPVCPGCCRVWVCRLRCAGWLWRSCGWLWRCSPRRQHQPPVRLLSRRRLRTVAEVRALRRLASALPLLRMARLDPASTVRAAPPHHVVRAPGPFVAKAPVSVRRRLRLRVLGFVPTPGWSSQDPFIPPAARPLW